MANNNEVSIDMTLDIKDFEDNLKKSETLARDTGKKLDQLTVLNMRLNIDDLQQKLTRAKAELKKLDPTSLEAQKLRLDISQYSTNITEAKRQLNNYVNTGDKSLSRLQSKFNQVTGEIQKQGGLFSRLKLIGSNAIDSISDKVGDLSTKFGLLAVGAGLLTIGKQALFLGDKLEQASISFETMLGSAEKAKILLGDLAIFAANTPFELIGLRDTAKQLLAFGIESDQIIPTLKALGDVSAGLSVPISQVAYAFGQVKVAGRLMGGELMQFTNAGVPLIAELSKNLGVAQKDIKEMVSEGKIGFSDVAEAFKTMTEEGGKFNDLMDKQTETLTGKWSNLKDTFDKFLEGVGTDIIPFAKVIVTVMSFALKWVQNLYNGFKIAFNFIDGIVGFTILSITNQFHKLFSFFSNIQKNVNIFAQNIGSAFSNFPGTIAKFLDKALENLEGFINYGIKGVNKLAKALGMQGIGEVKFGRIGDKFGEQPVFKEFDLGISRSLEKSGVDYFKKQMGDIMKIVEDGTEVQKELNTELEISSNDLADTEVENTKKVSKEKEKALQTEAERQNLFSKYLAEKAEERNKILETGRDIVQEYYNEVAKGAEESGDKIKDLEEKLKDLNDEFDKTTGEKNTSLAERKLEILERQKELEKEIQDIINSKEGTDPEKIQAAFEEQKKLKEEAAILEANIDKETFDELQAYKNLTKTEQILFDFEQEKASIEAKKVLLLEAIELEKVQYDGLNKIKESLEVSFTSFLQVETDKRLAMLEQIRLKAIETARALKEAGVQSLGSLSENTGTNTNNTSNTVINQTNNFTAKISDEDVKVISNKIAKGTQNASTGIK